MGGDAGDVDHAAVLLLTVLLHLLRDGLDHEAGPGHVNSDKFRSYRPTPHDSGHLMVMSQSSSVASRSLEPK